jgi:hypothetical protein
VVSLQARRELLKALDLIPPQYTPEAALAAAPAAPAQSRKGTVRQWLPDARATFNAARGQHASNAACAAGQAGGPGHPAGAEQGATTCPATASTHQWCGPALELGQERRKRSR